MAKYLGQADYEHSTVNGTGILLINLGTPDAATRPALRRYLGEFLSDPRVIELPQWIWWFVLNGIILNTRPGKSAKAYKKIWTEAGSPLLSITQGQTQALRQLLEQEYAGPVHVEFAMRYGEPSIPTALQALASKHIQRLLVFPLYPQYSAATTASTFDAVTRELCQWRWIPELRFINHYHEHPDYISAVVESIRSHWAEHGRADKLLFSYHGLPKDYFLKGDPYHCECYKTTRLVVEQLGLQKDEYLQCFQSRFGPREWLQPYTDLTLEEWAQQGVKTVQVICPGFSADCLETLEEIQIQNRELFLEAGGDELTYIPALNDQPEHIRALHAIIHEHAQGWPEFDQEYDLDVVDAAVKQSEHLAKDLGSDK